MIGVGGYAVYNKSNYLAFEGGGKKSETGKFWFALNNNLYFAHRDVVSLIWLPRKHTNPGFYTVNSQNKLGLTVNAGSE